MPKIVRFYEYGGPEVLRIEDAEAPVAGPGEVLIDVKAIGINRADVMFRQGRYIEQAKFPTRLGYDASGVVRAVGEGVRGLKAGDAVNIIPRRNLAVNGTYCEQIVVPEQFAVPKPDSLSFVEAAAVWMQYLTAYGALIMAGGLRPEELVVLTAASSSVGLAAIQIANQVGAVPIATVRTAEQKREVEAAGARHAVAVDEEPVGKRLREIVAGKPVRVIFDAVGGPDVMDFAELMPPGGIMIMYGMLSREPTPFPLQAAIARSLVMRGYLYTEVMENPETLAEAIRFISTGLESGRLKPLIAGTFPFDEVREAHRFFESGARIGKTVLTL